MRHHLIVMHITDGKVGIRHRVAQDHSMDGIRELLGQQFRLEATVVDTIGEEQHRPDIALVVTAVKGVQQRGKVGELVGEIELLEITDFLAEKAFINLDISVQGLSKGFKLRLIVVFVERRILVKDNG